MLKDPKHYRTEHGYFRRSSVYQLATFVVFMVIVFVSMYLESNGII